MTRVACLVLVVTVAGLATEARQTTETATFDVASIKRNVSGDTRIRFETPPGRLNAVNIPLRFLIRQAYRVPEARIVGGPGWLDTDRFDVAATARDGVSGDAIRQMLRMLLQQRFALTLHQETREMPIYELRLARPDGALGPGLRRSDADCAGKASSVVAGKVQCGILVSQGPGSGSLRGGGATIANFTRLLGDFLDRPVNDLSGLTGTFDLDLQFTAPRSSNPGTAAPGALASASSPDEIPVVFTALQEQMGLTLDAKRGRADVWVVDSASPPSAD